MLYPLLFKPILKKVLWGGEDICLFKGIRPVEKGVGESWELSDVPGDCSVVDNGPLAGQTLQQLICTYGKQLLGEKVSSRFGDTFPLLIKFIDARDHLSVQVHPDDDLAYERHRSFGKTEMWYVVKAAKGAALYSGFSQPIDPQEYLRRVADNTFSEVLQRYEVNAGDLFFLPAGRVHAIGAGCFVAEIQQTSNITYRIYDYNRKDAQGNERELHTCLAKEAIDYTFYSDYRTHYVPRMDAAVELVSCRYFTSHLLDLTCPTVRSHEGLDSFVVYICLAGGATLSDNKGYEQPIVQGQTVLIPADTQSVTISPTPTVKLLQTYIP